MKYLFLLAILSSQTTATFSQYYRLKNTSHRDRLELLQYQQSNSFWHSAIKNQYFNIDDISIVSDSSFRLQYPVRDSVSTRIYANTHHFLTLEGEHHLILIDPVLYISAGHDGGSIFQNTRGITLSGTLGKRVYFQSTLTENQRSFLNYQNQYIDRYKTIPAQGYYKPFQSSIIEAFTGYDYLNANGTLGVRVSPIFSFSLGHDNHFIGDGVRSLLLGDNGQNYFYFQWDVRFWKIHYQSVVAELSTLSSTQLPGDELLHKKYMTFHYLDFVASPHWRIGIFEAVVYGRPDYLELQYLNPLILYRSIERQINSPDNALFGINSSYFFKKTKLYSQLLIDEWRLSEITANNGWWGNKLGYQLGIKTYDLAGKKNFTARIEYNKVRPYTYTHRTTTENPYVVASYTHYNQPLAHPLGANFSELIFDISYPLKEKWTISATMLSSKYGDSLEQNVGHDIRQDYRNRLGDFDQYTGQGVPVEMFLWKANCTFEPFPNYFVVAHYVHRRQRSDDSRLQFSNNYFGITLRANIKNKSFDY